MNQILSRSCTGLLGLATALTFSLGAQAQETALDTTYASGNGQDGNVFDISSTTDIVLTRVDCHIDLVNADVEIYYINGGYTGQTGSLANWTFVGTVNVNGMGDVSAGGVKTPIPLSLNIPVPAGQTVGVYVTTINGGINYTNGTAEGNLHSTDGTLSFFEGQGMGYPFSGSFSPRVWNGTLYYGADCDANGLADFEEVLAAPTKDIDGDGVLDVCSPPALMADSYEMSVAAGGSQNFALNSAMASNLYLLLGSAGGTSPGLPIGLGTLPLNGDSYFFYTLSNPNSFPLANSFGVLDPAGQGTASFTLPAAYSTALVGAVLNHAYVALDGVTAAVTAISNPVPLTLLP